MPRDDEEHSVFREPHMRPDGQPLDPSEAKADQTIRHEEQRSSNDYRDGRSVFDEPDIFPGRAPEVIEQDWSCSQCGYNLRGLETGRPCPECGHKELYRPAARGTASYQSWLERKIAETSQSKAWLVALLVALGGGPWAVLAASLGFEPGGVAGTSIIMLVVVFGPAMEETMKIGAAALVVEVRPYLFRSISQVQLAALGAALLFAVIENLLYLYVYVPNHSTGLALWRWTVCVAMHVGCTMIATRGLTQVWQRTVTELRPPKLAQGLRMLVVAIIIHGSYNAGVVAFNAIGF